MRFINLARNQRLTKMLSILVSTILLLNVLLPSIAAAAVKRDQFASLFSVICTSSGVKIVDASENQSAPNHSAKNTAHCVFCIFGGSPFLQSKALSIAPQYVNEPVIELLVASSAIEQVLRPSAAPRAPPRNPW